MTLLLKNLLVALVLFVVHAPPSILAFLIPALSSQRRTSSSSTSSSRLHEAAPFLAEDSPEFAESPPLFSGQEDDMPFPGPPTPGGAMMSWVKWDTPWDSSSSLVRVEGRSLRTCSLAGTVERVQLMLQSQGRPVHSQVELWQGPDYTPWKVDVYCEDGEMRPFKAIIETPLDSNAIAIRNSAPLEFPVDAVVKYDERDDGMLSKKLSESMKGRTVQGGAVYTVPFAPTVEKVQVLLKTDGRHLKARVELLEGPNNIKQSMDVYSSDGYKRPFFAVLDTPGTGSVVRVVNQYTVEYPIIAYMAPYFGNV